MAAIVGMIDCHQSRLQSEPAFCALEKVRDLALFSAFFLSG